MKKWKTPKLIVITRNKPEENVLCICKSSDCGGGNYCIDQHGCPSQDLAAS